MFASRLSWKSEIKKRCKIAQKSWIKFKWELLLIYFRWGNKKKCVCWEEGRNLLNSTELVPEYIRFSSSWIISASIDFVQSKTFCYSDIKAVYAACVAWCHYDDVRLYKIGRFSQYHPTSYIGESAGCCQQQIKQRQQTW